MKGRGEELIAWKNQSKQWHIIASLGITLNTFLSTHFSVTFWNVALLASSSTISVFFSCYTFRVLIFLWFLMPIETLRKMVSCFQYFLSHDAKILGKEHDKRAREVCEAIEIRRRGAKTLNREEGTYLLSHIYDPLIKRTFAGKETSSRQRSIARQSGSDGHSDKVSRRSETKY